MRKVLLKFYRQILSSNAMDKCENKEHLHVRGIQNDKVVMRVKTRK